ncbi:MAG: rod shape-determining protein MreD [Candidatus Krumholzibacteriaceae bacterium]
MKAARIVLVALVVFVIQVTAIHHIAVAGCTPDLAVILLVALALERGPVLAVVIGFLLGFLQDLGNASLLGMNALAKSVLAYGISRVGGGLLPENVLFKGFIVFAACIINDIIVLPIATSFSVGQMIVSFFRYSLLSALYSAIVGICIFALLELLTRRVVRPGGGY